MKDYLQILICEDIESDAALLVRQLEQQQYKIVYTRVDSGDAMYAALQSQPWDLIISDFNIPGFGGPEALQILHECGLDIPFILVSGTVGEEVAVSMMKQGANDYLMKNNLVRLGEVVRREMEEAKNRQERNTAIALSKANEIKYRTVIDNSLYAIFLGHPGGRVLECNKAARELFGYSVEEYCQLKIEDLLDFSDPNLKDALTERNLHIGTIGEFIGIKKGGQRFHCEVTSAIFNDSHGEQVSCWMLADISARKNSEKQIKERNLELKKLSQHLKNAREDERTYIAREIHDQLGQLASAIKIELDWLRMNVSEIPDHAQTRIENALNTVSIMIDTTRKIATHLRPAIMDHAGLNASLEWQCHEFEKLNGIPCRFTEAFDDAGIKMEVCTELFRICQETLTNVMRHANATAVSIEIYENDGQMELVINDNGKGFDTKQKTTHLGLVGIRERVHSIDGVLQISSMPGKGTRIRISVPLSRSKNVSG